ncbi:LytS/YhcK type 5TM receptor domain-containing protein [Desulfosporosinus sp. BG]|uniref:LytS/YhcK type 5TM receptor domain-containing protein n=1 Tax=Desulfosporosinus sp. BG TaxID=1633135 RepID=UPI00083A2EA7|nr:LytS/YhcK type 5TM receptor domain-containing protein [Desulfosporosinus sp. BG]ODA39317.1 Sporulation kinase [Desulfosporosinus sp. BG]
MYYDFVTNVIDVLILCGSVIWIDLSLNRKYSHYILGVMFGLVTVIVINNRIVVVEGRFFDFRHITMTMAGFIGGPVTAAIATIISALYRYNMGGSGTMGGITNIIVFACLGSILGKYLKNKPKERPLLYWFIIGTVMALILLLIMIFIPLWQSNSASVLRVVAGPLLIITPLATTIIFHFYFRIYNFFGKASILNKIINSSPINLMIFDAHGPILVSKNLKDQPQDPLDIEDLFQLKDTEKTWLDTREQQHREIATKDGRYFDADLSSFQMPSGQYACVAIVNDVTERRLFYEKLVKHQEETVSILESMTDCFVAINKNWQVTYINRAGEIAFGKSRDELLGQTMDEIHKLNGTARLHYNEVMTEKRTVTFEIFSEALGNKWFEISAYPTETGMICYLRDITSRKIAQDEMARLDRLNLVGQLAAGIGHEIRNPMTTVRGYLQLLGEKPDCAARKHTFDLMISEIDRANSIITEFLSLAQTKQTELKLQNLNDILIHLYPLLEADAFTQNKQIKFIPGEIPHLALNEKEISQLVLNLTRNGFEAMEERGCLTLESYLQDDQVVLAIEDEGCGMLPENISKVGTPFFTTKDNGTGLGLATCYKIAESHQAKICVDSNPSGTTFLIRFPLLSRKMMK